MKARIVGLVIGFALWLAPRSLWADAITIISIPSDIIVSVSAGATDAGQTVLCCNDVLSNSIGAVDATTGQSATASAFLSGNTTTSLFSVRGTTATSQTSSTVSTRARASSSYEVVFDINQTVRFDLGGVFSATQGPAMNNSLWSTQLLNQGDSGSWVFTKAGSDNDALSFSGLLQPGQYTFATDSLSDTGPSPNTGGTGAQFNISLTFSDPTNPAPTPEPASLLLLASGVAGITLRRARRQRQKN